MRNIHAFYLLLLLLCVPIKANPTEVGISVNLHNSQIEGMFDNENEVFIFRGIPYAKPPIGEWRWQSPVQLSSIPKTINAQSFKPACMQDEYTTVWYKDVAELFGNSRSVFQHVEEVNEDCLYLNIWTNSLDQTSKKPVMVWVHGGADTGGWSYEPNYLGHHLANKDVVVVSINYRLNIFGFFLHPELSGQTGNFGLEDEMMALQWIKDYISFYGGDPDNITYFGESAGGAHVSYLIAAPKAKGLFKRGIIQSGAYNLFNWTNKKETEKLGQRTQTLLNAENLQAMKNLPAENVLSASATLGHPFRPNIDGELIPDNLVKLFEEGSFNNVDLMIGSNKNEDYMYINGAISENNISELIDQYYPQNKKILLSLLDLEDPRLAMDHLTTNQVTLCPSVFIARSLAKNGNNVYQYHFTRMREGSETILSYHGAEIPYVFNTHDEWLPTNEEDIKLTASMMEYWVEFAKKGTPNSINNLTWREFGTEENYLILDQSLENSTKLESEFCDIMIQELIDRSNP
jgi:para-nitrobenzyl esterase